MSEGPNGVKWWTRIVGHAPPRTDGEKKVGFGISDEDWQAAQEQIDARRLIEIGQKNNDPDMVAIGQRRLRVCLGKETPEDLE